MATANCPRLFARMTRFRLRTFLVVVVVVGAGSGFIAGRAIYVLHVLECVPQIEKHGVQVLSDFHDRYGLYALNQHGQRIDLVEWCLSDPEYISIQSCNTGTTESVMKKLATLHTLKELNAANLSAAGLRQITRLSNLEALYLQNSAVDDNMLAVLIQLPKLQRLQLVNTPVTDHGLCHVAQMLALKELYLHTTNVTPAGLEALRKCRPDLNVEFTASSFRDLISVGQMVRSEHRNQHILKNQSPAF